MFLEFKTVVFSIHRITVILLRGHDHIQSGSDIFETKDISMLVLGAGRRRIISKKILSISLIC